MLNLMQVHSQRGLFPEDAHHAMFPLPPMPMFHLIKTNKFDPLHKLMSSFSLAGDAKPLNQLLSLTFRTESFSYLTEFST